MELLGDGYHAPLTKPHQMSRHQKKCLFSLGLQGSYMKLTFPLVIVHLSPQGVGWGSWRVGGWDWE